MAESASPSTSMPGADPAATTSSPIGFDDRLLIDAARRLRSGRDDAIDDTPAVEKAAHGGGAFEQRLVRWASLLSGSDDLRDSLDRLGRIMQLVIMAALVVAAITGVAAARGGLAIGRDETTNVFALLLVLLGVQTVLLVAWLVVMLIRPNAIRHGSLGAAVVSALSAIVRRWASGRTDAAAAGAYLHIHSRGPIAQWMLSAISHGMWLTFNATALATLLIFLTTRQYTFVWETTILSAPAYEQITRSLATPLDAAGVPTPGREDVAATRWPDVRDEGDARRAWSGFVLGCLVLYGLVPRALLTAASLWRLSAARRTVRLPLAEPGYAALRDRLMADHARIGVVDRDADSEPPPAVTPAADATEVRPAGPPAVVGLELDRNAWPMPPALAGQPWQVLGVIETGEDRRMVTEQLRAMPTEPSPLLVIAELPTTPDRGLASTLRELQRAVRRPVRVLLTGGHRWRSHQGSASVGRRVEDWRGACERAGIDSAHVLELDLDHLTDRSTQRLIDFLSEADDEIPQAVTTPGHQSAALPQPSSGERAATSARRIEAAFDCIIDHARKWSAPPDTRQQSELYRDIAHQFRGQDEKSISASADDRLRWFVPRRPEDAGDVKDWLGSAAARVTSVLPPSLKSQSGWLAAGATAGAVGCLAASSLIWPAAVAMLPAWSTIGAAIGGLTQYARTAAGPAADEQHDHEEGEDEAFDEEQQADLSELIRGAALYAVLLDAQGRDESTISRILDRTFAESQPGTLDNLPAIRHWLDDIRHRYDLALARETAS